MGLDKEISLNSYRAKTSSIIKWDFDLFPSEKNCPELLLYGKRIEKSSKYF